MFPDALILKIMVIVRVICLDDKKLIIFSNLYMVQVTPYIDTCISDSAVIKHFNFVV